jgi:oligopeptide transport system substrate-binding protein
MVGFMALLALVVVSCAPAAPTPEVIVETVEVPVEKTVVVEVPVEPEITEWEAKCTYNVYRMGWVMDYSDANNIVNEVFHPDSPFQYTFWDDQTFRDLVDQALAEKDADARVALWQQAQEILVTDYAAVIPGYHYDRTGLVKTGINYEWPPFGQAHIFKWSFEDPTRTTLRWRLGTEPPTLDINLATDTTSHAVMNQLMEGPYRYTAEGTIEPAAAESYEVSEDGLTYTIHLRDDLTWHDGVPVTAQHFVDGITRLLKPDTAAEYAYVMYYISGAEDFNTGVTDDPATLGLKVVDDLTFQVILDKPQAFFDSILAFFTFYPVRLDIIEEFGDQWTEAGNFVGNGPYILTEWAHEDHVTIEKNPNWHDADKVQIERVVYPIIYEDSTALAAYEAGELDVSGYPSEELPRILEDPVLSQEFVRLPYPGTWYMGLNTRIPPTDNLNFRKALASAVDFRTILDEVLQMPWRIEAHGVIPPEIPGYQDDIGYPYDPEAAQEYLQAALEEMGIEDPGEITVEAWHNRGHVDIFEAVADMWETNLGINTTIINMEWAVYLDVLDTCND